MATATDIVIDISTTIDQEMGKIMEQMGWTDGTFIPIANAENRVLMQSMQDLLAHKERRVTEQQAIKQRVAGLKTHHQRTLDDLGQNGKLLEAHRSQMSDEHHMFKVSEHTDLTLTKRLKELQNTVTELQKHDKTTNDELGRTNKSITKLSHKIHWARDALAEWRSAMEHGDQLNKIIKQYCQQDHKQSEHLERRLQQAQIDIAQNRAALVNSKQEQAALERILERTGQLYRQAHQERRRLVDTWKNAVLSLQMRQREITDQEVVLEKTRLLNQQKSKALKVEEEFYNRQVQNNRETEHEIAELNTRTEQMHNEMKAVNEDMQQKQNDEKWLKKMMQGVTLRLQQKRHVNRQAGLELTEKTTYFEHLTGLIEANREKLNGFQGKNLNAQQRMRHLDEMVNEEEKQTQKGLSESTRLDGILYRTTQVLLKEQNEHKHLRIQIYQIEREVAGSNKSLKKLNEELLCQTELVYNVDYRTMVLSSRLAKMYTVDGRGYQEDDPKVLIQEKLLEDKMHTLETMKKMKVQVEDDMYLLNHNLNESYIVLERLQNKLEFRRLEFEGGVKERLNVIYTNNESLLEQSMITLRVHEMDQFLQQQRDKTFSLHTHQNDLQLALNERLTDVKMRQELKKGTLKHCLEELSQWRADVTERDLKIAAMQARYSNALERLGHNEDGTFVTATQIKIETAAEKQMLLRDGHELTERLKRAESDLTAMKNTLVLLNFANQAFKRTLEPVKEISKEMIELKHATERFNSLKSRIKAGRKKHTEQIKALQELGQTQFNCENKLEVLMKIATEHHTTVKRLHNEILEQKPKLERAHRDWKLASKTARSKVFNNCEDEDSKAALVVFQRQLKVREMQLRNDAALQQLADMMDEVDVEGLASDVEQQLSEKGLSVPQRRTSSNMNIVLGACKSTSGSLRSSTLGRVSGVEDLNLSLPGSDVSSANSSCASNRSCAYVSSVKSTPFAARCGTIRKVAVAVHTLDIGLFPVHATPLFGKKK